MSGSSPARDTTRAGSLFAIGAYGAWGVVPIFWKLLQRMSAWQILAHRVVWSLVLMIGVLAAGRRLRDVRSALRAPRTVALLVLSSALIGCNWGLFIWAVTANRLVDASFGYFMNPLVNVVLGVVLLREKLRRLQWVAVGVAGVGLAVLLVSHGRGLAVGLTLAGTFAAYGLCRKVVQVDALVGLFVETLVCAPFAVAYLVRSETRGEGLVAMGSPSLFALAVLAGPITALPLASFAAAARRLPLSTLGFFQYLSPSLQLGLAVLAFGERVEPARLASFALIWAALVAMTADALLARRRAGR